MHCKSLWIKASAKCINVNVNVNVMTPHGDQTFPNIVTSSYNTITEEEKQIKVHINIWGILRQNAPIAAYVEIKTKTTASTLVKSYLFSNRIF